VTVDLYAASSAVDTDFTAKLVDVYPDGNVATVDAPSVERAKAAGGILIAHQLQLLPSPALADKHWGQLESVRQPRDC
jgi:hypothetical protein